MGSYWVSSSFSTVLTNPDMTVRASEADDIGCLSTISTLNGELCNPPLLSEVGWQLGLSVTVRQSSIVVRLWPTVVDLLEIFDSSFSRKSAILSRFTQSRQNDSAESRPRAAAQGVWHWLRPLKIFSSWTRPVESHDTENGGGRGIENCREISEG